MSAPPASRIQSIDLLRGLDVLLMLFVNEIAGVPNAPAFLLHVPSSVDGMTITDVVFPAFLFVVGMALPFALGGRLRRGDGRADVWRHVLSRTLALLMIGVLMVNAEHARPDGPISPTLWNLLITVGAVLAWQAPAAGDDAVHWPRRVSRVVGFTLLVLLVLAYRGTNLGGLIQIRPYWWGILGLIGWAYLVGAALYLWVGDRPAPLVGCVALLYCFYLADAAGAAAWLRTFQPYLGMGGILGSHGAIVVSGTVLGVMLSRQRRDGGPRRAFVASVLAYAAGLAAAGLLLHTLAPVHAAFRFSKEQATPPWCLVSSALAAAAWVAVYVAADVRGWRCPRVVDMAGENALVAYLLAPALLALVSLSAPFFGGEDPAEWLREPLVLGIASAAVFAWLVVRLCAWLRHVGVRVQL